MCIIMCIIMGVINGYYYVPLIKYFLMGVIICIIGCLLWCIYLNILTLFFYKCVWLKPNNK